MSHTLLRSPGTVLRHSLLSCLVISQFTLALRAGVSDFVIMASVSWLGGALLLIEHEQDHGSPCLERLSGVWVLLAFALLLWSLLVLSLGSRFYDPLFWFVPLASLSALGILAGAQPRSLLLRDLIFIGLLAPAQALLNVLWPLDLLATLTARTSSFLLWLLGTPALAMGRSVVLSHQVLLVDGPCTGTISLSLSLATLALLALILPIPTRPEQRLSRLQQALLAIPAVVAAGFLINCLRIVLLAHTPQHPGPGMLAQWRGFAFWHEGAGSDLFSLLVSAVVCGSYVLLLEQQRERNWP